MPTLDVASFILGGLLILLAAFGGGVNIKELHLPELTGAVRVASFVFGLIFIGLGVWIYQHPNNSAVSEKTFYNPMYRGVRLDQCYTLANDCGQKAAERWCRSEHSFTTAVSFEVDSKIGERGIKTKTIGNEEICNAPYCTGYRSITCR
jgi:hypothetical protein